MSAGANLMQMLTAFNCSNSTNNHSTNNHPNNGSISIASNQNHLNHMIGAQASSQSPQSVATLQQQSSSPVSTIKCESTAHSDANNNSNNNPTTNNTNNTLDPHQTMLKILTQLTDHQTQQQQQPQNPHQQLQQQQQHTMNHSPQSVLPLTNKNSNGSISSTTSSVCCYMLY